MGNIFRYSSPAGTYTVSATAAQSEAIPIMNSASGIIHFPATVTSISPVTFEVSDTRDGTYTAVHDSSNDAISQAITASKSYRIPDEVMAARFFRIVADGGSNITVTVSLKT